ncbi:MAG: 3'-5' exonuclease domain-containing protein 2, partial [Muribaculaceae bacterium]|nr:3'-5' exonuclease domain-containing protein 2 [Muribaculaceae bacterium]
KEQISSMPAVEFPGKITVIETPALAHKAIAFLRDQKTVGFDTETRPSFRKGHVNDVALIQISTDEHCFLFRINRLGITDELKQFLEDTTITKIGLSLKDDFHVLHRTAEFTPGGFIDLQDMVKQYMITDCSLQKIYGIIFNHRISKSQRLSNWEAQFLTPQQQAYASIDAWACLRIYNYLNSGAFDPLTSPYLTIVDE